MTPAQYWKWTPQKTIEKMCERAGTSIENFKRIALYDGNVGRKLAERLAKASRRKMSEMEILYPERYEK
jgi:hypothetical protein